MFYFYCSKSFNPFENLAIEEYLLNLANSSDDIFVLYLWQNDNTLVIGRNQDAFSECNFENMKKYSTKLARRKTGGGAVYHDINNLNFSFIIPQKIFNKQKSISLIKNAIEKFDVEIEISGRNDLLCNGKKFSGSAYLNKNNVVLHHGTILLNSNFDILNSVLNVNPVKLRKNAVKSVKNRVINLKDCIPNLEANDLILSIKDEFLFQYNGKFSQIDFDFQEILKIKQFYEDDDWIFGDKKFVNSNSYYKEFPFGIGQVKVFSDGKNKFFKFYSDSLNISLVKNIQHEIDKSNFVSVEKIFEFINNFTNL